MLFSYTPPVFEEKSFSCPLCGVFARQEWGILYRNKLDITNGRLVVSQDSKLKGFKASYCGHCGGSTIWYGEKMVYPYSGTASLPNPDMPVEVQEDFLEAREILVRSPRSAAALLRLALQKLCSYLGCAGSSPEADIQELQQRGLPPKVGQVLHSLRIYGKQAVAPGQIDAQDDSAIAHKLLACINIICDTMITQSRLIDQLRADIQ